VVDGLAAPSPLRAAVAKVGPQTGVSVRPTARGVGGHVELRQSPSREQQEQ